MTILTEQDYTVTVNTFTDIQIVVPKYDICIGQRLDHNADCDLDAIQFTIEFMLKRLEDKIRLLKKTPNDNDTLQLA